MSKTAATTEGSPASTNGYTSHGDYWNLSQHFSTTHQTSAIPIFDNSQRHPGWSDTEWRVRKQLASLYRVVAHFGMTDVIETHISARISDDSSDFLINRYGVMFHEMRATDLVKLNVDGEVIDERKVSDPKSCSVNAAGVVIHTAMHAGRKDLHVVVHTHTNAGIAVATQESGLLPISQHALKFYNQLGYHDFEGLALNREERARLIKDMEGFKAMILRNHGLIVGGHDVSEAFHEIYYLERACQAQVQALAGGQKIRIPPPHVCELTAMQFQDPVEGSASRALAWGAALRLVGARVEDFQ